MRSSQQHAKGKAMTATAIATEWTLEEVEFADLQTKLAKLASKAKALGMTGEDVPGAVVLSRVAAKAWSWRTLADSYMMQGGAFSTHEVPQVSFKVLPADAARPRRDAMCLYDTTLVSFRLTGTRPRMAGWSFMATLESVAVNLADGNLGREVQVRRMPDADPLPAGFEIGDGTACDHCGKRRTRTITVVVGHEDGRILRVGRSCLRDFLGHASPEQILNQILAIQALMRDSDDDGGLGISAKVAYSPLAFVTVANATIRVDGYVSRKTAGSSARVATSERTDAILSMLARPRGADRRILDTYRTTDEDVALAEAAIAWGQTFRATSEFDQSLSLAARMVVATIHTHGVLAYLPLAYKRTLERRAEAMTDAKAISTHQGAIGAKIERRVTVTFSASYDGGAYGATHLHLLVDADGNRYKWWASARCLPIGSTATVTMGVKAHEEDRKSAQQITVVLRVAPVKGTEWVEKGETGAG